MLRSALTAAPRRLLSSPSPRFGLFHGRLRAFSCHVALTNPLIFHRTPQRYLRRPYSTPPQPPPKSGELSEDEALARIERIEGLAQVFHELPNTSSERLATSYLLICEILAYLSRHGEEAPAYLSIFTNTAVPPDSDVARARKAIFTTAQLLTGLLSAVPDTAPLRKQHAKAFALHGALEPLLAGYDGPTEDLQAWMTFWGRGQPIIVELAGVLDESRDTFLELPPDVQA
ncbi:hypothetical protein HMN09_01242700 [Mycena chlorophos]|uniref:Uncharacterized protein n=1 Tax=Mycena chlorophos TaxID=658473 RepID=A0A8H6S407_MYCCL|nr:hypothetical protein HMN09_01242700 [Mycena chlorophos]